ncbi:nitroreductase family protein [Shewanella donghaensis]|uniref:nitroreductase family protein n=1 Tax=Shewanella donghaensis TaxID=238836 RepID=UPI001181F545|nr:nitroreductase family protein [Shewanella donghaensis]
MKQVIKKLLPRNLLGQIKSTYEQFDVILIQLFSRNGFLASVYYAFFSQQFYREHKAVLQGRLAYEDSLKQITESSILLRRNIHRIEKGLIMRPRRDIFAGGYISETVDCYCMAIASVDLCADEKKWASDVLQKYFSIVGQDQVIDEAKKRFEAVCLNSESGSIPYPHADLPACPVDYDELLTLFKRRRSVRWFQDKAVDISLINKAVDAATLAPSACNRQPFEFHVISDTDKATDIANCAMGTVGFADNLPCMIAIVGNLDAYPAERDRHIIYIDGALASMQLMLACETLGLSTCSINWPDIELREKMLMKKLGLAYHQRVVMLMAVGFADPDGGIPFSQKKNSSLLVKEVK